MKKNLVSIVTPCYNGEYFIRRFLKSILNQTYSNIEMILINDDRRIEQKKLFGNFKMNLVKEVFDLYINIRKILVKLLL